MANAVQRVLVSWNLGKLVQMGFAALFLGIWGCKMQAGKILI